MTISWSPACCRFIPPGMLLCSSDDVHDDSLLIRHTPVLTYIYICEVLCHSLMHNALRVYIQFCIWCLYNRERLPVFSGRMNDRTSAIVQEVMYTYILLLFTISRPSRWITRRPGPIIIVLDCNPTYKVNDHPLRRALPIGSTALITMATGRRKREAAPKGGSAANGRSMSQWQREHCTTIHYDIDIYGVLLSIYHQPRMRRIRRLITTFELNHNIRWVWCCWRPANRPKWTLKPFSKW